MELSHGRVAMVVGPRDSGKTTACDTLRAGAAVRGLDCAGLISPGRFVSRRRVGSDVVDVRTGERRAFATELLGVEGAAGHRFDARVAQWACEVLARACPCDLLLVDEIGPLELDHGAGWTNAIDVVGCGQFAVAVVTVRPRLADRLVRRLAQFDSIEPPIVLPPSEAADAVLAMLETRHAGLGTLAR